MSKSDLICFSPGLIVITPGAMEAINKNQKTPLEYLSMHLSGNWGCVSPEDKMLNDLAIENGERVMSAYLLPDETKIWIITEAEYEGVREATTILLPEEY